MTTFNVYRRESNDTNPPVAIATGLTSMSYSDSTAVKGESYLYSIGAVKSGFEKISEEQRIIAVHDLKPELNVSIQPYGFWMLNDETGNFLDYSGNNNHIIASPTVLRQTTSIDPSANLSAQINSASDETNKYIGQFEKLIATSTNFTVCLWMSIPDGSVPISGEFFKLDLRNGQGFSLGFAGGGDNSGPSGGRFLNIGLNGSAYRGTTLNFGNDARNVHLSVRWQGGTVSCFLNGELKSARWLGDFRSAYMSVGIGRGEAGNRPSFAHSMSRVATFNGALTDADILKIATQNI